MQKSIVIIFLLLSLAAKAQEAQKFYNEAMNGYREKNYSKFYDNIKEAYNLRPTHQGILYQFGVACALTNKEKESITYLKKAILIDASFKLEGNDFNAIKNSTHFKKLVELQKELQTPVVHSEIAFTIKDRSLHSEGIDYDPLHNVFFIGSIHKRKIVKAKSDGTITDFCPSAFEGMASIFGIKADVKRNLLWACSSPMPEMENYDSTARSSVFKFDLSTGKLLNKYSLPLQSKANVLGDLILNKKGDVFISDSQGNMIYTLNQKTQMIEPYYSSPDFLNLQGIAFSDDEKYMFIADYRKSIYRLEVKTKKLEEITTHLDISLKGIDGIYFYKNSLIAIQNGVSPLRSTQYILNKELTQIVDFKIIDRKHPDFNEPTLGVIHGDTFYYIANSQWGGYDNQHHIKPDDQLQDIVILKNQLK